MNIKEKMMDFMMGKLSPEEKKDLMSKMMEKFFADVTPEEKQTMIKDMMENMMRGGDKSQTSGNPMMDMMKNMMGTGGGMMGMMSSMMGGNKNGGEEDFNPMDMCRKMMSSMTQTSEMASFATPEIRVLFEEWVKEVDNEILAFINDKEEIDPEEIAKELKISKESVLYFISRLAQKGKLKVKVKK